MEDNRNSESNQENLESSPRDVPKPEKFLFETDDWEKWLEYYERYRASIKLQKYSEDTQINNVLLKMGKDVGRMFDRLQTKEEDYHRGNVPIISHTS